MVFDGQRIGRVEQKHISTLNPRRVCARSRYGMRARNMFYTGYVYVDQQAVCIETGIDLDERCDKILAAWLDPESNIHTKYWLRL